GTPRARGVWPDAPSLQPADLALEHERDDEREQNERLDERQTQDERRLNLGSGTGVTRNPFERRSRGAALRQRSAEYRNGNRETRSCRLPEVHVEPVALRGGLRESHRRNEERAESGGSDCELALGRHRTLAPYTGDHAS